MKRLIFLVLVTFNLIAVNVYAASNTAPATPSATQQPSEAEQNKQEGDAFLAQNKQKLGVVLLPDGLQYKIITKGTGPSPTANDNVIVHYMGRLINGEQFDSSYKRGEPATFPVNAVIPGWQEALKLMKVGSTWEIYVPSNLAYGSNGMPPTIGPNKTLIFKVQLLDVKKP